MAAQMTSFGLLSNKTGAILGYLINASLFRCALTERKPKGGFSGTNLPSCTTVGVWVSLYVRGVKGQNLAWQEINNFQHDFILQMQVIVHCSRSKSTARDT